MGLSALGISNRLNAILERFMFAIVLGSMGLGALFHTQLAPFKWLVPYAFGYMTLATALSCSWRDFGKTLRTPIPLIVCLGLLHLLHPIAAKCLGTLLYGAGSPYASGLILGTAVPTGVTSVIWVGMSGGNVPLSLTVVTADTLLSPLMVPATVLLFAGQHIVFDVGDLMAGLLRMVVLPTIIGVTINDLTKGRAGRSVKPYANPISKVAFGLVVAINVAVAWPYFAELGSSYWHVLLGVCVMAVFGYVSSYAAGALLSKSDETRVTVTYSAGMRNISAGIVIAMAYFSPMVAIPVVSGMLFQQPLATVTLNIIRRIRGASAKHTERQQVAKDVGRIIR